MAKEQEEVKKGTKETSAKLNKEKGKQFQSLAEQVINKAGLPKDMMGLSDTMIEGIYGQAYRLYNTGKYKDASQLFRLLIMLNATEGKYAMGLAACFHMLKEYDSAIETYSLCALIDAENPIPHFHSSDCYLQMGDPASAMIALEMAVQRSSDKPEFETLRDRAIMTIESLKKQLGMPVEKKKEKPKSGKKKKAKKK